MGGLPVNSLTMKQATASISPKGSAAAVARNLTNSYEILVPGAGHSAIESGQCPMSMALAFFEDPTRKPDDSCLSQLGIKFKLPADSQ